MQINGSFANSNWKHHDSIKNLWYHVLKFLKKALFTALWLSGVNLDSSLVTQYSLKFYVSFSFIIVLLFLHCGSCFLFVWAGMLQTAIVWCFFDVWIGHYQLFNYFSVKGYLCYRTIFCHNVVLDVQLMNFFIWRKNNVSFFIYLGFLYFCEIHRYQNLWRHHRHWCIMEVTLLLISLEPESYAVFYKKVFKFEKAPSLHRVGWKWLNAVD